MYLFQHSAIHPLIFIAFVLGAQQTLAQEKLPIYADEIPGLYEANGSGIYTLVLTETLVKEGVAELKVLPPTRAKVGFESCVNCCHTPGNKNPDFYDYGDEYIETEAISTAKIYIFTATGQPIISSLTELKGKRVGTRRGMPYGAKVESAGLTLLPVNSIAQHIEKLSNILKSSAMAGLTP